MRAVLLAGACALAVYGCDRKPESAATTSAAKLASGAAACASTDTYGQLKQIVFDQASQIASAEDRPAVTSLGQRTTVTIERAVLDSEDHAIAKTACSGQLSVVFPPSASYLFGGVSPVKADIHYTIQPAANGSGLVYSLEGAAPIIDTIAEAHLSTRTEEAGAANAASPDASAAGSPATANGAGANNPSNPGAPSFDALAAIRASRPLSGRLAHLNTLLANAYDRDVTGEVRTEQATAMRALRRCGDEACVQTWFGRREAALRQWQE